MASNVHINVLGDSDLLNIFKALAPYDRLRVSEVSKRWFSVGQDPWREVTHLELASIPSQSVGAIVRKCPNLTHLILEDERLILDDLKDIALCSLKALELRSCTFVSHDNHANKTALPLFRDDAQTMEVLVLHEHQFDVEVFLPERHSQRLLPASLKRLQLSGINRPEDRCYAQNCYLNELINLYSLESLILHTSNVINDSTHREFTSLIDETVCCLDNLRELLISPIFCDDEDDGGDYFRSTDDLLFLALNLPKLEILFFPDNLNVDTDNPELLGLFAHHPTLCVLVLQGYEMHASYNEREIAVPVRRRFSDPAEPLPFLHVFLSKSAAELFRFEDSPANGLKVHLIDAPFPEMLEREEIREIFGDSWLAKQIREWAKRGTDLCTYRG